MNEYYNNERPDNAPVPEWNKDSGSGGGGGGGGGNPGGGSPNWGGGSGSGGGEGSGGGGGGDSGGSSGSGNDDVIDTPVTPEWEGGGSDTSPMLRASREGMLLTDPDGFLLAGEFLCGAPPAVIVSIPSDTQNKHLQCVLLKFSDESRRAETVRSGRQLQVYCFWHAPGSFDVLAKWQAGHWNHAEIGAAEFAIYGVTVAKTLPLTQYVKIASVTIEEDGTIYVNGLKGAIGGNQNRLE